VAYRSNTNVNQVPEQNLQLGVGESNLVAMQLNNGAQPQQRRLAFGRWNWRKRVQNQ